MVRRSIAIAVLALLLLLNVRVHRPGGPATVHAQLRSLDAALADGAAQRMQALFPEGYVFTWALYGLSSAQAARQIDPQDPRRARLLAETAGALRAVRSETARSTFDRELNPPYGAFYASWSLYLLAEYVRAAGPENLPAPLLAELTRECDRFVRALEEYGSPFLESYALDVWPADTAPGIAALGIHDQLLGPRYPHVIRRWVAETRARLDPLTGGVTFAAEPTTGNPRGPVRGESLALISRLLVDADPRFAREQYALLREHFLDDVLGVPGIREYPRGLDGRGDVDSGPILFGFSGPAIVVGAAAARVHGDRALADALLGGVELVGVPVQLGGRRVYAAGRLPVGDAFIAWARSSPAGVARPWEPAHRWFVPFYLLSATLAALVGWWGFRPVRRPDRTGPARTRAPGAAG